MVIIYGTCKSCTNHIPIYSGSAYAVELIKSNDHTVRESCKRCGVSNTFLANQMKAKLTKRLKTAVVEVTVAGIILSLFLYTTSLPWMYRFILLGLYVVASVFYLFRSRKKCLAVKAFNKLPRGKPTRY